MHDPVSFGSFRSFTNIENQRLLNSDLASFRHDHLISSCGLPVTRPGNPIGSRPVWVLSIPRAKKVPFLLAKHRLTYQGPTNLNFLIKSAQMNYTWVKRRILVRKCYTFLTKFN
ncbi:hypothetical protein HanRHA438_Chr03g0128141 [Helianthus annuus]|nr:hypothetical protein HanIR_Chr03g0127221 [Helianthus annuus]KAJ0936206.1 hypothetical protein HanRHA438_Chr03g0128141 [Helianthus annuus]